MKMKKGKSGSKCKMDRGNHKIVKMGKKKPMKKDKKGY